MNIYVASSWRNLLHPEVIATLRECGHHVYDYRSASSAFGWHTISPQWEDWTTEQFREALKHPSARAGYHNDITALRACDACVLVLPSGRSASWELGYALGQGKRGFVLSIERCEPELMYAEATILASLDELRAALGAGVSA